jgi:integrase
VDDVKTIYSGKLMSIDPQMLRVLKAWRHNTRFSSEEDWMFASPPQVGRLPVSYPWVWQMFQKAAAKAGIGKLGTHSLRHSYRSWLDAGNVYRIGRSAATKSCLVQFDGRARELARYSPW